MPQLTELEREREREWEGGARSLPETKLSSDAEIMRNGNAFQGGSRGSSSLSARSETWVASPRDATGAVHNRFRATCSLTRAVRALSSPRESSPRLGGISFVERSWPGNSIKVVASFARSCDPRSASRDSRNSDLPWPRSSPNSFPRIYQRLFAPGENLVSRDDATRGKIGLKWPDELPGQSWKVGRVRVDGTWSVEGEARRTEVVVRVWTLVQSRKLKGATRESCFARACKVCCAVHWTGREGVWGGCEFRPFRSRIREWGRNGCQRGRADGSGSLLIIDAAAITRRGNNGRKYDRAEIYVATRGAPSCPRARCTVNIFL